VERSFTIDEIRAQQRITRPERLTYDVPEAGAMAGLGRNASYEAAKRGEIPILRIGRRLLVPKREWDRRLTGESASCPAVTTGARLSAGGNGQLTAGETV
jgi:hypothetical protein